MRGCIQIYTGNGKGKTTAAVGAALRCAGHGKRVLFSQFLKDGSSGEIKMLEQLPGICVVPCREKFGFSFLMTKEERAHAVSCYTAYLWKILEEAMRGEYDMLILDEAIAAYNLAFFDTDSLLTFLKEKPEGMEVILTGRNPAPELLALADYISEIQKIRHPFDEGLAAREGIEF